MLDLNIMNSPSKHEKDKGEKYQKHRSRPHRHKHQNTENQNKNEQKIHLKESSGYNLRSRQTEENGRNNLNYHHRRHYSDYYTPKESINMSNDYVNKTHNEFLRKMGPEMDEIESPLRFNELLKLNEEQLKKSLKEIKRNKMDKIKSESRQTSDVLNKLRSSKGFNGNKTFLSDPEIVNNKHKNGQIRVTKNNDKVDICNLTLGGIFMSPEQKSRYSDAVTWGGNIFVSQKSNGFNKKRTFITEWQSAANNNGVFVNNQGIEVVPEVRNRSKSRAWYKSLIPRMESALGYSTDQQTKIKSNFNTYFNTPMLNLRRLTTLGNQDLQASIWNQPNDVPGTLRIGTLKIIDSEVKEMTEDEIIQNSHYYANKKQQ